MSPYFPFKNDNRLLSFKFLSCDVHSDMELTSISSWKIWERHLKKNSRQKSRISQISSHHWPTYAWGRAILLSRGIAWKETFFEHNKTLKPSVPLQDIMIGEEASKYRSVLDVKYPMEEGIVRDWNDMEVRMHGGLTIVNCKVLGPSIEKTAC